MEIITRLIEESPKLAALLFQDEAIFKPAIEAMKSSGNQLMSKMLNHRDQVRQISLNIQEASEDYRDRLNDVVEPLKTELAEMQEQLDSDLLVIGLGTLRRFICY